ncbi:hypothetical protein BTUL_0030g00430 [Botrytis tulipae]|uniref:RRM domain-containing protein n=1 Tax=Botrytis tulipae TaxID=87230 RepID=A0A4Z1F551_9HELO|nr:hypothetical protein BTUL_0030g00430 [Botrytis tulipae]
MMENSRPPQAPQPMESNPERWDVRNLPDMPAWISTDRGRFPKRESAPTGIPCIAHCDVVADAKAKATSLFDLYPDVVCYVRKPTNWDDLYFLWDAADIQLESPGFLYYVMFFIGEENERRKPKIQKEVNDEINEYTEAWVTNHRDLVLNSAAGSMYQYFCQDEPEEVAPELKSTVEAALENCRLRLLQATTTTNSIPSHDENQPLHPQVPIASSIRAVSGNGTRHIQAGNQVNRSAIAPMTGKAAGINLASHGCNPMQPQSKSSFHANRTASMPLNPIAQKQLKSANRGEAAAGMTWTYPQQQPLKYDRFMKNQRNMGKKINATTSLNASPTRSESYQNENGLRNKSRHRGNSIETHQIRGLQWFGPHGTQPHKLMYPSQNNQQQNMFNSTRGSPPRALQPEPIYFRNDLAPVPFTDNFSHRMGKDLVGSRMELPNDARNVKNFENSKMSQPLADVGGIEGAPKLYKTDDFCLYTYDSSASKCSSGRTLYMTGADLAMFYSHELKNLLSEVGRVLSIKFLLRPNNNGPTFITFDADVLAMAIERFDGYKMPNGRILTAGYPLENSRERSGSNSSYHSYHGDNQNRYIFNPAAENRAWPKKNSISQHRPSKSQSGQNQFRYQSGNHMTPGNVSDPFPYTLDPQSIPPYPLTQAPLQQFPGHGLSAAFTEVIQHDRGVGAYLQQQTPRAVLNNRTNTTGTAPYRSYSGVQADRHRYGTRPGVDHNMANLPNRPVNKKENSPIKKNFSKSRPGGKNSTNSPGRRQKKTVDQDTSGNTTPIKTPVRSTSQIQLNNQNSLASPKASPIEESTSSITGQSLATEIKVDTMAAMKTGNIEQVPVEIFESPGPVDSSLPEPLGETVAAAMDSDSMSQGKPKKSKKNKKQFKSNNKTEIDKENNISVIRAILSRTESTITNPSLGGEDELFSGDSTRKPSVSSAESISNDTSKDSILQQATRDVTAIPKDSEQTTGKSLDNEVKSEPISTPSVTTASITPNAPLAKSDHKKSKTHGSSKDFKKQSQSNLSDNNKVSSTTNTGPARKTEPKAVKQQGKISKDGGAESSGQQEQSKTDLKNKKKRSLPEVNQEKGQPTVSVDPTDSTEWPPLTPSKSSPSSIADGKPPQIPALPALNNRRTKEVILPALPLKPHRQS